MERVLTELEIGRLNLFSIMYRAFTPMNIAEKFIWA